MVTRSFWRGKVGLSLRRRWWIAFVLTAVHPVVLPVVFLFSPFASGGALQGQTVSFPYEFGREAWALTSAGLGLTSLGFYLNDGADFVTREEIRTLSPETVNSFDRSATENWAPEWAGRSDLLRIGAIGGGLLVLGVEGSRAAIDGRSDDAMKLAAMFGEVVLLTAGATYATKVLAGRRRPFLFNQSLSVEERYRIASTGADRPTASFFSGHASGAFAVATFASTIYQDIHGTSAWSHLVWGSTLSLASLTAYARVKAGVHYPSDVIVGALVGAGIGYLVPRLHRKDSGGDSAPTPGMFQLSYQIRF